jgi:hypothetical protein
LAVLGFELRALHLLGSCSSVWATPPALKVKFLKIRLWKAECTISYIQRKSILLLESFTICGVQYSEYSRPEGDDFAALEM